MAQRIGPAGSVRVAVRGKTDVSSVINVFWTSLTVSGTVTQADLDTWTAAFGAAFKARFQAQLPSTYTFDTVSAVYFVDGTPLNVIESTQALSGAGSLASTNKEYAPSIVLSWLSGAYWRGGKPRTYLMGPTLNISTTGGTWNAAYVTSVLAAANSFRGDINALTGGATISGTALGFVSFFTADDLRPAPLFFAFTGQKVHPRVAHQRRRDGKWLV